MKKNPAINDSIWTRWSTCAYIARPCLASAMVLPNYSIPFFIIHGLFMDIIDRCLQFNYCARINANQILHPFFWITILDMIEGVAPKFVMCPSCSISICSISAQKIYILVCQFLRYDAICINHVLCDFDKKIWLFFNKN